MENSNNVISTENATDQFNLMINYYDLDGDLEDESLERLIPAARSRLVSSIKRGRLEIAIVDDSLVVTQYLKKPVGNIATIVYKEVSGKSKITMSDDVNNYYRVHQFLAVLSGESVNVFQGLTGVDNSIAETLGSVFLAV